MKINPQPNANKHKRNPFSPFSSIYFISFTLKIHFTYVILLLLPDRKKAIYDRTILQFNELERSEQESKQEQLLEPLYDISKSAEELAKSAEELAKSASAQADLAIKQANQAEKTSKIAHIKSNISFIFSLISIIGVLLANADKIVHNIQSLLFYLGMLK
ncbi:MAG: hypothetical protein OSJ61_11045 [Lachnospiraceae bacterium]|nr:hypothetical protein [Lachnospiraceae bacterium]